MSPDTIGPSTPPRDAGHDVHARIDAAITSAEGDLVAVSRHLHEHPELCFEERIAHATLTDFASQQGWAVERRAYGLDTAFRAHLDGGPGPNVAVICEYDALPGIGHACGHNIIAAAGISAAVGAAAVIGELGGRLTVLGTPAEEGGGGKALMIDRGALDGIDAAIMIHPADSDDIRMASLAISELHCRFHGRASHAASAPERGQNALDAAVLGYQGVAALRQHIADAERIHGIFSHGGAKPNIVPEFAETTWYIRSTNRERLAALRDRVIACQQAGALAAGCEVTFDWPSPFYDELVPNDPIETLAAQLAADLGRPLNLGTPAVLGSTDMGNVSQRVPSLHAMVKIAPSGTSIHTPDFADAAASTEGDRGVVHGAKLLARVCAALWSTPEHATDAQAALERSRATRR